MRRLSRRAVLGLLSLCTFFALVSIGVGTVGMLGVRSTAQVSNGIVTDQLASSNAAARISRSMDSAHLQGDRLFLSTDPAQTAILSRRLFDSTVPQVDSQLTELEQLHAADPPDELASIRLFASQWTTVRDILQPSASPEPSAVRVRQLDTAYAPLSSHIDALLAKEVTNADIREHQAAATATETTWLVVAAVLFAVLGAVLVGWVGVRRIRRTVEPENEQINFVETLQVTDSEREAHELLKRHLERAIPGSDATVLNRNNSADRLEAMTGITPGSCLATTLEHASPRSCLAIRSAHPHVRTPSEQPLLGCAVCGDCPGSTSCTPFTVSGEVIGAVLVTGATANSDVQEQRIRDSVVQAAPVLANLRNLAVAEVRAATDSLTGLANKRAVADTLKRMLAHASRTMTPLSLLMIDLDHFKHINDRLGHPIGDQALANVGAAIRSSVRASDFAGRNGGEEFAVLLPDTDLQGASATAEKIRLAIASIDLPGAELALTGSLGIAVYPDHALNAERLERLADAALYTAKRSGRNRVVVANADQDGLASSAHASASVGSAAVAGSSPAADEGPLGPFST